MFEKRVLWSILGTERQDVAGGWRNLHNEGFIMFLDIIKVIILKIRWVKYALVASKVEMRNAYNILIWNREDYLKCLGVDESEIMDADLDSRL
jgi:hypothetical protein